MIVNYGSGSKAEIDQQIAEYNRQRKQKDALHVGNDYANLLKLYRLMHLFMRPAAISAPGELVVEHNV
jgi:hypothetical protein